ncbi:hypothetical protein OZ71_gp033 [Staphylococcus phage MCE-2014]|uniref:Uncharacterized protein n=10 Tax=Kayvirus TaxID=1857843 RepID=A0A3T0IDX5_9CAUD|nr:hypothetical protein F360_gp039 [Staphylococcus phage G15]YP_009097963.1 hypothetical protein OZ71_gp033 [Staphylococcus phage MCE-2014]AXU40207.1 hypothetical protein VBSavMJYL01_205 [Staphylococcus phage VB_SavM_JYL01]AZU97613.1 hypothetical protein VBSavMJYL02_201 [Staphylococcus phage VB-SavM-JYL02]UVD37160.1 hypothetical protein [Staphylococcus phage SYL]UYD72189.1 hypothetical protein [Staphylococcus phage LJT-1]AFF28511.1 hypothetical protein GH15_039 [Staphylococcus phage G15]
MMFGKAPEHIMEIIDKEDNILGEDLTLNIDYKGINLTVKRHPHSGHLNGYINVPTNITKEQFNSIEDCSHGGITYDEHEGDYRVLGFDCAHYSDMTPYAVISFSDSYYRDLKYVLNTLKDMADCLKEGE